MVLHTGVILDWRDTRCIYKVGVEDMLMTEKNV